MTSVTVVDYGLGNLFNVIRAFQSLGINAQMSSERADVVKAERLVIPGVGAFGEGMRNLERLGLVDAIRDVAMSGRPILGICLGMQILMHESEEFGTWPGLRLVAGHVDRLEPGPGLRVKVPQVGWNSIDHPVRRERPSWDGTVLRGIDSGSHAYFVHSYAVRPSEATDIVATTTYGGDTFCSVIRHENVVGFQFHPEKSAQVGLSVLRNWLAD
jgi:glutamine amidotransferase